MLKDIKHVKDKVEFLLESYPMLRDCDKKLWLAYLAKYHNLKHRLNDTSDPYGAFKFMILSEALPPMESVRRVRQKLQEEGKYLGAKRTEMLEEAERVRDWARGRA